MEIKIKDIFGDVLFSHKCENNTIKITVEKAVESNANLRSANLRSANLSDANLRSANLSYANLSDANLRSANLRSANLSDANLRSANLRSANLSYANLSDANLRSANLSYANLSDATGNKREIQSILIEMYHIVIHRDMMFIGCESHKISDWMLFDDDTIKRMDNQALYFWKKWKATIEDIIIKSNIS